ncbi:MAG TPA: hypothetical protein PK668_12610 [Myxococcota bacterium]|nr:hypothetical protein [Myxococcota bacterium]HRY93688.1 hypothetical protein [Myxococcota bacterium]
MSSRTWDQVVGELGVWKRHGERAVHKPLLLLFLLARAQRGQSPRLPFSEIEAPLRDALLDLGPPWKVVHPEYPFWHLQAEAKTARQDTYKHQTNSS